MSDNQIPSDWRQCCTCDFWGGTREPDSFGSRVYVKSNSGPYGALGKCLLRDSGWYGTDKQYSQSCEKYKKWGPLK